MSRGLAIQVRVDEDEKARIRARATAAGVEGVSEYLRELGLGNLDPMISSQAIQVPSDEGAKPEARRVPPVVESEIKEAQLGDDEAREAFIARRTRELHGTGFTTPVARRKAVEDWEAR